MATRFMKMVTRIIARHPRIVLLITGIVTLAFLHGVSQIKVQTEMDPDLPKQDPIVQAKRYFEKVFGKKNFVLIGIERLPTIYDRSTLEKVSTLVEDLKSIDAVLVNEITSLTTTNNVKGSEWGLNVAPVMEKIPETPEEFDNLRKDIRSNEMLRGRLVSEDETMTIIVVNLKRLTGADRARLVQQIYRVAAKYENPERFFFAGDIVGDFEMHKGIAYNIVILLPLSIILLIAGLYWSFRSLRGVVIPLTTILLSILWTVGLMGYLGYEIDAVTSIIPVLLVAVVSSYGVHLLFRYYEVAKDTDSPETIVAAVIPRLAKPLAMASITSAIGTFTLITFTIVSIKAFGVFSAIGICFGVLLTFIYGAPILALLKGQTKKVKTADGKDFLDRALPRFIHLVIEKRTTVLLITAAVVALSIYGVSLVNVGTNIAEFFPGNHLFTKSINKMDEKVGGANRLNIMIEAAEPDGIKDPKLLHSMMQLEEFARSLDGVGNTDSFARLMKRIHYVINGEQSQANVVPPTQALAAQYLLLYSLSTEPGELDNLVDHEYRRAKVTIFLTTFDDAKQQAIIGAIQQRARELFPENVQLAYEGSVYWVAVSRYVVIGKLQNIISSLLIVLLFCIAAYKSIRLGLLSIVPLTIATLSTFGLMGFLGISLNFVTALITSLAVGVGVDFAIHFITHFREEIQMGYSYEEAVMNTTASSGKAIILDALSNVLAFVVFVVSGFVPVQYFGYLVTLTMISVAFGTLVLLPVLFSYVNLTSLVSEHPLERTQSMVTRTRIRWAVVGFGLVVWAVFTFSSFAQQTAGLSGRQIMANNDIAQRSDDTQATATMRLINEYGQERVRKFHLWEKMMADGTIRALVKFQYPGDVKGAGLLTIEHTDTDDDQWLYLPALRKTRRISAADKGDSFMGSDFAFEDMEREDLDEYEYSIVTQETVNGEQCYRVQAMPVGKVKEESSYSKRELLIRQKDFVKLKTVYYDKRGLLFKELTYEEIRSIKNKIRSFKWVMENVQTKHKTVLTYDEMTIDQGLGNQLFTERQLVKE